MLAQNNENNVVEMPMNKVYKDIITFIEDQESNHTATNYKKSIEDFFAYITKGRELIQLTIDDIEDVENADIKRYRTYMRNHGMKAGTINPKISALRSLFRYLKANKYNIDPIEDLFYKTAFKADDTVSYGAFKNYDEAMQMVDKANELNNGEMKSILFDVAIHTSIRKSALLDLKPRQFKKLENHCDLWLVTTTDKGSKKVKRAITKRLWKRIEQYIEKHEIKRSEKIFNISPRQVNNDIRTLSGMMGYTEEDNIVFHSFRKVASFYEIDENGDIEAAAEALGHGDIRTTVKHYHERTFDYSKCTGVMMEQKVDMSKLDELSAEELREIIIKCSKRTQNEILGKME